MTWVDYIITGFVTAAVGWLGWKLSRKGNK